VNDNVKTEAKLDRLRCYLREWAECNARWQPVRGFPKAITALTDHMKAGVADSSDLREGPNPWVMELIDTCLNDLCKIIPEASLVLLSRYLNKPGPAVYRFGRLSSLSQYAVDLIADQVELSMIPMLERKGLPL
jgi:hypothetical protein